MTGPLRIAVIGAGLIGRKHVEVMLKEPLCAVAAVADPTRQAAAFATEQGIPYFADYAAMLDAARPDGVIVATPNALHVPVALACIERGVPVLVEKPIAEMLEAAWTLVEAAERAAVPLLVGHHWRHNPIIEKAREIVRSGAIGRLTAISAQWLLHKPDEYFDVAWRRERGGGPILINLIHDIDDLRFICGEIECVQAAASNGARGFSVEDTAAVILRFADGALGTVTVSDSVPAPWSWELTSGENPFYPRQEQNCYLLAGTEGSLAVPRLELWRYEGTKGWGAPLSCDRLHVVPGDPLVRQLRHFCQIVRGEAAPLVSGADATRTLAAVQAVIEAAQCGRPITLFTPPNPRESCS